MVANEDRTQLLSLTKKNINDGSSYDKRERAQLRYE